MTDAAAVVLAGGKSSRMGTNKALLKINKEMMLEGVIKVLAGTFPEIIISANDNTYSGLKVKTVFDIFSDCGPLAGIHAGLMASSRKVNFFVACDMPFVDNRLAVYMVRLASGFDVVVPKIGAYHQPLFAVYSTNCIKAIERQLKSGRCKVDSFYNQVCTRFVGPEELQKFGDPETMFFNVNTPVDLEQARFMAGRGNNGSAV